jgi:hypothetical protein
MMHDDRLAVLDLYERHSREGETFLTGAFGGVRVFVHPIKGAHPDDRCWRMYLAKRIEGLDKDRAKPTAITKPAPTGWAAVNERRSLRGRKPSMKEALAAVGMAAPFYQDELGLEDDPDGDR